MQNDELIEPSISGVPEEVQQNIIEDIKNAQEQEESTACKLKIGVSISENEDLAKLGFGVVHLKDLMVEIARNLLINDFAIIYGGDLRKEGFTEIFADLAYQYRTVKESKKTFFTNYFSFPIYLQLSQEHLLEFKKYRTKIVKIAPPKDIEINPNTYINPDNTESKYIWARCLSTMRLEMIIASNARILVGGKVDNYLGAMPGVLEEAKITLETNKPLYLVGGYGGCAKYIADAFSGKAISFIDDAFHLSNTYQQFKNYYTERNGNAPLDLHAVTTFFQEYGVERLALKNGLSVDENLRLFSTTHQSEIIYLIFKGLNNISTAN